MMPLAPHISLPAIGHMTATTASTTSDNYSSSMSSKPKLNFSIDSIVGRNNNNSNNRSAVDCHSDSERHSPRVSTQHKSSHLPVTSVGSVIPQMIGHRLDERSAHLRLSPTNRSATNMSPMSTPSPISMVNGSASSPYLEPNRISHVLSHPHTGAHPAMKSAPLSHQLMMAHHMSPMSQPYHQAVPLYPWHSIHLRGNPFDNRFHGMPFDSPSSFLLPPFRKPKRIRTAFSPSQLLKLEEVFEKNQYVVGSERKQLASGLGLSETQIKVWFQNRRTKHKRQKHEDQQCSSGGSANKHSNKSGADSDIDDDEDDDEEDIDIKENEDTDCNTNEMLINSDLKHHKLWY